MGRRLTTVLLLSLLGPLGCRSAGPSKRPGPLARGSDPVGSATTAEPSDTAEPSVTAESARPVQPPTQPPLSISAYARLLPDTLPVVIGIDVLRLRGTKLWLDVYPTIVQRKAETITLLEHCGLGSATWRGALVGFSPDSSDPVAVLVADGLGRAETLGCLRTELLERDGGLVPWKELEAGRAFELRTGARMLVVDPDAVVIAPAASADQVDRLARSGGRSALDPDLQTGLPRADLTRHVWVVGRIPAGSGASPMAGTVGVPQDFTGWMDLSFGARIVASIGVENPSAAASVNTAVAPQARSILGMLGGMGGPAIEPERLHIGTMGSAVTFDLTMTPRETDKFREMVVQQLMPPPSPTMNEEEPAERPLFP